MLDTVQQQPTFICDDHNSPEWQPNLGFWVFVLEWEPFDGVAEHHVFLTEKQVKKFIQLNIGAGDKFSYHTQPAVTTTQGDEGGNIPNGIGRAFVGVK